jgi:Tol biopolymer transport system component/uncharacterized protein YraI
MKPTFEHPAVAAQDAAQRRRWGKPALFAMLFLALAGAAFFLLTSNTVLTQVAALEQQTTEAVAAQPQGTPPAGMPPGGAPGMPITDTLGISGTVPAGGPPPAALATATLTDAPTATPTAAPVPIVAIAGSDGATVQPLAGGAAYSAPVGAKLELVGRSADGAWLVTAGDDGEGWVSRDAVITFNIDRLGVVQATPPAALAATAPVTATVRVSSAETRTTTTTLTATAAVTVTPVATVTPAAAAQVTAQLDVSQARSLNVRSGPGVAYARIDAITAGETLTVTGRTAAGDWLAVTLPDGATTGWASARYLLVTGDVATLPEVTPAALPEASTPAVTLTSASADSSTSAPTPVASDAAASASRTQSTGLEGTLVFQTGQGGTIYAYDLETGDLRALTNGFDPAISPDGTTVAFGRVGNNAGLYLIDIDGSNERQIYSGPPVVASPKWNTDGTQLLFAYATSARECRDMGSGNCVSEEKFEQGRYSDLDPNDYALITLYTYDVGVVDVNGDGFHSLSALNTVRAPDWAPDGIVYQSFDGIQIMSTQGNDSRVILYDALKPVDQDPDWAGERIVFQRPGASHWEIWTADANGATLAALTQPQTVLVDQLPSNVSPAYSPDGSQIAFVSNRTDSGEAGAWRIWVMNADGSNQRALPIDVEINYTFGAEQMVSWGG